MNRNASELGPPDADLVRQAQRGDSEAFGRLVTRYQERVFNTCYRLCHDHAEALDLTQAAFLRALEALPRFEERARFYTWLFRIAVNLALSHRRTRLRRPTVSLDHPDAPQPVDQARACPAAELERREQQERVAAALARLDADFRAALVLRDVEGLDYADIAEILGVPVGTVKSRIFRGRVELRQMLEIRIPPVGARSAGDGKIEISGRKPGESTGETRSSPTAETR